MGNVGGEMDVIVNFQPLEGFSAPGLSFRRKYGQMKIFSGKIRTI